MLSDVSSILPVITKLYDATGERVDLDDVQIVQFDATLTLTRSTAIGPPTVIVSVTPAGSALTSTAVVNQRALAALEDDITAIVFAPLASSLTVTSVEYLPLSDGLTADDTNFATVTLKLLNPATAGVTTVDAKTTKITGLVATGDWTPGTIAFAFGVVVVPAGQVLVVGWTSDGGGTGVAVPSGAFRIT